MNLDVYLLNPNKCPKCGHVLGSSEVFDANITHNLNTMAEAAGIYGIVWRPEENGIEMAGQLVEPLKGAIADMKARPDHFKQFDSDNGWGLYINFLPWLEKYAAACEEYPDAEVSVSR